MLISPPPPLPHTYKHATTSIIELTIDHDYWPGCELSTGPGTKCQWTFGRANEKIGGILVKSIDHSGKVASVQWKKKISAWLTVTHISHTHKVEQWADHWLHTTHPYPSPLTCHTVPVDWRSQRSTSNHPYLSPPVKSTPTVAKVPQCMCPTRHKELTMKNSHS